MRLAGIVAEYNPFHGGHAYHIALTRESATHTVAVMSGHFVQRGDIACMSKWARTEAALRCGCDLVLELPLPYCVAGAQTFARGAVFILHALGCVDILSFGCETDDLKLLQAVSRAAYRPELIQRMHPYLAQGRTFAAARELAIREMNGEAVIAVLRAPNNILSIEYLHALDELGSPIAPLPVPRAGAAHDETGSPSGVFASASQLREMLRAGRLEEIRPYMPSTAFNILAWETAAGRAPCGIARMERALLALLRRASPEELAVLPDLSEGLEHRLFRAIRESGSLDELYARVKTKRYTLARIRRLVLSAALGIGRRDSEGTPPYIRVLGMNAAGEEILRTAKHTAALPLLTRAPKPGELSGRAARLWELENRATDLFALAQPSPAPCGMEYTTGMVKV